ncbi:hypothetical protein B7494_g447 [Chlorociboria aeruginascens]|nr:hypothetical protein B7494_g447 [Chlorociboria aeruginascens]
MATLTLLLTFLPFIVAQKDNGAACSCFRTAGHSAGYFSYHRFHDFRNIPNIPKSIVPALIPSADNTTLAPATSDFFETDAWNNDWQIQNWNNSDSMASANASILMVNSLNNVYIGRSPLPLPIPDPCLFWSRSVPQTNKIVPSNDATTAYTTYLNLRTARLVDFQSAAEIDSTEANFHYLSLRLLARTVGSPGACSGAFTYLSNDDPQKIQEADIEILTSGPRDKVQYTNQPSTDKHGNDVATATVNSTNPSAMDWSEWNSYRYDWMPGQSSWYVNGQSVANISFQTPKNPMSLLLNMWSDGGEWTGNMSLYDEADFQIQWIEIVYNTSGAYGGSSSKRDLADGVGGRGGLEKRKGHPGCAVVCSIDEEVNVTGTPAILYNNTGSASGLGAPSSGSLAWIPVLVAAGAAAFAWL